MAARLFLFLWAPTLTEEGERESAEKQYAITRKDIAFLIKPNSSREEDGKQRIFEEKTAGLPKKSKSIFFSSPALYFQLTTESEE